MVQFSFETIVTNEHFRTTNIQVMVQRHHSYLLCSPG